MATIYCIWTCVKKSFIVNVTKYLLLLVLEYSIENHACYHYTITSWFMLEGWQMAK